jgi:hypothetical protein
MRSNTGHSHLIIGFLPGGTTSSACMRTDGLTAMETLAKPPKSRITLQQVWLWLIYPLIYLVYTLDRGAVVGFYPYPFLDPDRAGGTGAVVVYCIAIFIVFLLVSWGLIALANMRRRPLSPPAT